MTQTTDTIRNIRNICIIAHVDHGKTTLVDHILEQAGLYAAHETTVDRVMDSDAQERERGITIMAKNASFRLSDLKVNIVDTPGHADFGGEVERIMGMVDGAILLVDAAEGPLPQTRFVLEKAIKKNLKIILCVNKVDRSEIQGTAMIQDCVNKTFDLFVDLGASDSQMDFPIVYACARKGWCVTDEAAIAPLLEDPSGGSLAPLYELIKALPAPAVEIQAPFLLQVANIIYSDYLGYLAVGRVRAGGLKLPSQLYRHTVDDQGKPVTKKFSVGKILVYEGLTTQETDHLESGDIGLISGADEYMIGDTLGSEGAPVMPRIEVEKPTMRMIFSVNTTPGSGQNGQAIQSRELRARLLQEVRNNPALGMSDTNEPDQFYLEGRGELQFSIIIEKMRREGLEFMVGRPSVLLKRDESDRLLEPFERLTIDVDETSASDVTSTLQEKKGTLVSYENLNGSGTSEPRVRLIIEIPTRGILGMNSRFKTITKGTGLMSSEFLEYRPHLGSLPHRISGSLIADRQGKTTAYALSSIQERGALFIGEGYDVYEGMIIGECARDNDLNVFASRPKKLTNVRATGSDGLTLLATPRKMSLEQCIEWIDDDDWIEVTPKVIRLRKKVLAQNLRSVKRP